MSIFEQIPEVPQDGTFALMGAFKLDPSEEKVNLVPGIYRDEQAKTWVLPSVKEARASLLADESLNHDISPQLGHPAFVSLARDLVFKDTIDPSSRFVTSMQTISGTGANHFIARLLSSQETCRPRAVWIPDPTWDNHKQIWRQAAGSSVEQRLYPYYDRRTAAIDRDALISTLRAQAVKGDAIILHACAHNPTGVDPSHELWEVIATVCEEKGLFPVFDLAYQGFATGDADKDAWAVRHFTAAHPSLELAVAQSFSKNFGLYGERIGALHIVANTPDAAARVEGQLKRISRAEITSTPGFGAKLVASILGDPALRAQWQRDLETMSGRLGDMRRRLYEGLTRRKTPGSWEHLLTDIGMFSMLGLSQEQVAILKERFHVYLLPTSRISVTGLTRENVEHVAESIYQVITSSL